MESQLSLILEYRYLILIPLSLIEGPIVAFFAGTLASVGYFNIWYLALFFLVRDIFMDGLCYGLGHLGYNSRFGKWLMNKFRLRDEHLNDVRKMWALHPGQTMFFSKLSYGVAAAFIFVAGMIEVPLTTFFGYGVIIAFLHYGTLLFVGYFFGQSFGGQITTILERIPYRHRRSGGLFRWILLLQEVFEPPARRTRARS
jgi:membrane protein DedA with SNARE-associated domain